MFEELNSISEKLNLWKKTENYAIVCIENYILETIYIDFPMLQNINKNDFLLEKESQGFLNFENITELKIIRTTYNIYLKNKTLEISGYFSLDIEENGNLINEWLVLK